MHLYDIDSIESSRAFALSIAKRLVPGNVISFSGDLGAGKTFLCREIIQFHCGYDTLVSSPTFNILKIYQASEYKIYHYDLYRLKSPDELYELGIEDALDDNVALIEWPELILPMLEKYIAFDLKLFFDGERRFCHSSKIVN